LWEDVETLRYGWKATVLAAILSLNLNLAPAGLTQEAQKPAQKPAPVPDAPAPQTPVPLSDVTNGPIRPGSGTGPAAANNASESQTPAQAPQAPPPPAIDNVQTKPPEIPAAGEAMADLGQIFHINVNFVQVPVTVKDEHGKLVPGLTPRDFKVYENNTREPISFFTVDPFPLSVAFVVDQSLPADVMSRVNDSLAAIQGALTPYDEMAVFSYSNGAQDRSSGFTGAQSARVPFVLSMTKAAGTEQLNPVNDGPFGGCAVVKNGNCVDPNVQYGRSAGNGQFITIPKEIHTLNDGILAAAKSLSTRPKERRRIIYVISDGTEYGSKAKYGEVLKYLETNQIAVYGTLVGEAARWGEGRLSRIHLPFTMYDNLLIKYTLATGGTLDSERNLNGIEKSYAGIAEEARTQYTLGYLSHQPVIDDRFRKIDVRVDRPNLEVIAKTGYYPTAEDLK
jgi:VWFA-related protein